MASLTNAWQGVIEVADSSFNIANIFSNVTTDIFCLSPLYKVKKT
jgi:hypothetical protein